MPYLTEKIPLADPFLDRRTRLLPCQRERALALREQDGLPYRVIAEIMGVSKHLVYFVINPDKHDIQRALAVLRRADGRYYDKAKHTTAVREHRQHKQSLFKAEAEGL